MSAHSERDDCQWLQHVPQLPDTVLELLVDGVGRRLNALEKRTVDRAIARACRSVRHARLVSGHIDPHVGTEPPIRRRLKKS